MTILMPELILDAIVCRMIYDYISYILHTLTPSPPPHFAKPVDLTTKVRKLATLGDIARTVHNIKSTRKILA